MKKRSPILHTLVAVLAAAAVFTIACNVWVISRARNHVFTAIDNMPYSTIGLLTCVDIDDSRMTRTTLLEHRVRATADLYRAGKIGRVLIGGSAAHLPEESAAVRHALLSFNIPDSLIDVDTSGSDLDVLIRRLRDNNRMSFAFISNRTHTYRPVFLGRHYGLQAVAYCAEDIPWQYALKYKARELFTRVYTVLDTYLFSS